MLRHQTLFEFTTNMGWIGVDLFFVLSGFLVSGLLFKEYLRFGNIKPWNFLIRRGFKIYPVYYIFYIPYLILLLQKGHLIKYYFLADMLFVQNYVDGWGYGYAASWSLAVEEHFYFGLVIMLGFIIRRNIVRLKVEANNNRISRVEIILASIIVTCFIFRVASNTLRPAETVRNFTMTHLRIDSLLSGVLVSYLYYFRLDYLKNIFNKTKKIALPIAFLLLSFTPFQDPMTSFFIRTAGFSLLYISFSIILICFLLSADINKTLNRIFSKPVVSLISKVGVYSYSIYIIHSLIIALFEKVDIKNRYVAFIVVVTLCILCGKLMSDYIEQYFLRIRDKFYPNRVQ